MRLALYVGPPLGEFVYTRKRLGDEQGVQPLDESEDGLAVGQGTGAEAGEAASRDDAQQRVGDGPSGRVSG